MIYRISAFLMLTLLSANVVAQKDVNLKDAENNILAVWKKNKLIDNDGGAVLFTVVDRKIYMGDSESAESLFLTLGENKLDEGGILKIYKGATKEVALSCRGLLFFAGESDCENNYDLMGSITPMADAPYVINSSVRYSANGDLNLEPIGYLDDFKLTDAEYVATFYIYIMVHELDAAVNKKIEAYTEHLEAVARRNAQAAANQASQSSTSSSEASGNQASENSNSGTTNQAPSSVTIRIKNDCDHEVKYRYNGTTSTLSKNYYRGFTIMPGHMLIVDGQDYRVITASDDNQEIVICR
ncbi:MAG: hypothetical protein QNK23_08420 [Crocinitomicaceae bacterium]|nr:hypothetical protein [Crocinitomicaceae bacterium]